MPALAMVTVCCSITSWMATRSWGLLLLLDKMGASMNKWRVLLILFPNKAE